MTLISDNQPSEILQPCEKAFNLPTAFISPQFSSVLSLWLFSAAPMRRNHLNAVLFQKSIIKFVAVIRFVADKFFRHSGDEKAVQHRFRQLHFMRRSTCKAGGDRKTGSVRNCHDPAPFAPFCPADHIAPFLAGTKLPSMNASRMSMPPRACKSAANSLIMLWNTPAFVHCWNRRWQVWCGGYRSGKSFHGAPVRSTHKMPFSTSRGSRGLRPRESFLHTDCKIIGSSLIHCLSVSSMLRFIQIQ
jgi:hypothetical protein